jgi:hypothetical protein
MSTRASAAPFRCRQDRRGAATAPAGSLVGDAGFALVVERLDGDPPVVRVGIHVPD